MRLITIFLCLVAAGIFGCTRATDAPKGSEPVMAFVAASTKDAVQEVAIAFKNEKNIDVKINADDSSKLATQISQDAPAHVFLSANEKWADFIKEKGYVQEAKPLLGNSLVIVTPNGNPARVTRAEDLTKASVKRVALSGPTVPAGIYAREALDKLKLLKTLEADKRIVAGDNV